MPAPKVTAVVLTYDGRELLDVVMPSLYAQTYRDHELLVVDNGSSDGTAQHVRERWPDAELIGLSHNVGVAAALNRGLERARGEYVALLNNDLELEPRWIELLVATLEEHPQASSATGKLMRFDDRDTFDAAGALLRWSGAATHRGLGERDRGQYETPEAIFAPCAGAALFRRSAFDVVGPFDEDFFAYQEDVDWGLRAQLMAFESRYEPRAVAYHFGGATTGREAARYNALQRRNQLLVVIKDYPGTALLRHGPKIVYGQLAMLAASVHERTLRRHLGALLSVLRALPATLRKRRAIQRGRRVELAQLESMMAPERYAGAPLSAHVREALRTLTGR